MSDTQSKESRPIKILVVDDEDIVLSIARDTLEDEGYDVRLAESGEVALEIIGREFVDFILTDIRMPGIDGLELANRAREIIPSVGIIFMTGYANLDTAKNAIKEGAYDYLMKPFEIDELRQAVKNAIQKKSKDTEKTLSQELRRLSDLNQLMYTISDRQSLMRLSLGFAMMQAGAEKGSIVFRETDQERIEVISAVDNAGSNFETSRLDCGHAWPENASDAFNAPVVITGIDEHPLLGQSIDSDLARILCPPWHDNRTRMVQFALKRGYRIYGFLILGFPADNDDIKESRLKFLSITAGQLAISLENITLLEESRRAYSRLKEFQDQVLHLERIAVKGEMSAEIGHELNNRLGVVVGNLSLLEHHLDKKHYDELPRYIKGVHQNLEKIKEFTKSLMDFTGLQTKFEECDIGELIQDIVDQLRTHNRFASFSIVYDLPATPVITLADSGQIQQLLYNLINNAADALDELADDRERRIEVILFASKSRSEFNLKVRDNGAGFNPEKCSLAFKERFTTKKQGHGLGLMVCRRIVDNHQGTLELDSHPGQGTMIGMTFPVRNSTDESKSPVASESEHIS